MRSEPLFYKGRQLRVWYKHYSKLGEAIYGVFQDAVILGQIRGYLGTASPRGDVEITHLTICTIETNDRKCIASGYAFCSSTDQFSRKVGRKISLSRALKDLDQRLVV